MCFANEILKGRQLGSNQPESKNDNEANKNRRPEAKVDRIRFTVKCQIAKLHHKPNCCQTQ